MLYLHPSAKSLMQKFRQFSQIESEGNQDKQRKMRTLPYAATTLYIRGLIGLKKKVTRNELRANDLTNTDLDYLEKLKKLRNYFL